MAQAALGLGLGVRGVTASPLPGPSGNVEYFLWLRRGAPPLDEAELARGRRRRGRSEPATPSRAMLLVVHTGRPDGVHTGRIVAGGCARPG